MRAPRSCGSQPGAPPPRRGDPAGGRRAKERVQSRTEGQFMPNIGPMELIVVLAIALMVLGPKKLPEVGRSLGKGIREFKGSLTGDKDSADADADARGIDARPSRISDDARS